MAKEIAEIVKPARSLYSRFPFGSPVGQPKNIDQQKAVLKAALQLLTDAKEAGTIQDSDISYKG